MSAQSVLKAGNFTVETTPLAGVLVLTPRKFEDSRGYFLEMYHQESLATCGITDRFVQVNMSSSVKGVVRGLHYQKAPHAMSKLVSCVRGRLFDVAVDIRAGSETFGHWFGLELSATNAKMLYIPRGFAHGFAALEEDTAILYQCDGLYDAPSDAGVRWNDPDIGIAWPVEVPVLSEKDQILPCLRQISPM